MINPILLLSALPWEVIDQEVAKANKCEISWIIKKIEIKEYDVCTDNVKIYVSWDIWKYIINSIKTTQNECVFDWIWIIYSDKTLPKVWDKVNFLINKDNYSILSDKKNIDWTYYILSWNDVKYNLETCKPNWNFLEFNKDIIFSILYSLIFLVIVLVIIFFNHKKKAA